LQSCVASHGLLDVQALNWSWVPFTCVPQEFGCTATSRCRDWKPVSQVAEQEDQGDHCSHAPSMHSSQLCVLQALTTEVS
jgi:hypothetical protein